MSCTFFLAAVKAYTAYAVVHLERLGEDSAAVISASRAVVVSSQLLHRQILEIRKYAYVVEGYE